MGSEYGKRILTQMRELRAHLREHGAAPHAWYMRESTAVQVALELDAPNFLNMIVMEVPVLLLGGEGHGTILWSDGCRVRQVLGTYGKDEIAGILLGNELAVQRSGLLKEKRRIL